MTDFICICLLFVLIWFYNCRLLAITIVNKSNKQQKFPVIQTNLHIERRDRASHINIALNLQNVLFEAAGLYDIHLELEGKRFDDFAFEVIQK